MEGKTFYTSNSGLKELKVEICKYLDRKVNVQYDFNSEVIVTVGGSEGIDIALRAMLDPGDEVLIPQPCYAALEVTYEVRFGEARWVPQTETIESLKTHWEPGKHYTYTVNLTMEKLTFTTGISSLNNRE